METPDPPEIKLSCTRCGDPDGTPVAGEILCGSCFQLAGSCCGNHHDDEPENKRPESIAGNRAPD